MYLFPPPMLLLQYFSFFSYSLNAICLGVFFVCILLGICITFWIWVVFNQFWEILDHHLLIYCLCSFFLPSFEVPVMYILNIFVCFTHLLCFLLYFSVGFGLCASGLDISYCLVFHLSSGISNELLMSSFMSFTYRISIWPFLWEIPIFWNPSSFIFSNIFLMYSLGTELSWGWVSVLIGLCLPVICPHCSSVVAQGRGFQLGESYAHFP